MLEIEKNKRRGLFKEDGQLPATLASDAMSKSCAALVSSSAVARAANTAISASRVCGPRFDSGEDAGGGGDGTETCAIPVRKENRSEKERKKRIRSCEEKEAAIPLVVAGRTGAARRLFISRVAASHGSLCARVQRRAVRGKSGLR